MLPKFKTTILFLIPVFLLFASDGIFSIQSILPLILITFLYDCCFGGMKINQQEIMVVVLYMLVSMIALLHNMFISPKLITNQSFVRVLYYLVILLFYFSMTHVKYTANQLKLVIQGLIVIDCIVSLYFIFVQKIWYTSLVGAVIDKNFVGIFLMLGAICCWCFILNETSMKIKVKYVAMLLLIIVGLFFSASRAAVLFCGLACAITFFFYIKKLGKTRKEVLKVAIYVFIAPIILIVIIIVLEKKMAGASANITWYWNRYFVNGFGDESVTGRFLWWKNAISLFVKRPIYGYGIGNINVSGNSSAVTHNTYLDFLVDQGLIGFSLFLFLIWNSCKRIIKNKNYAYYGIIFGILIGVFNLSATRSTFLWFALILLSALSKSTDEREKSIFEKQ